MTRVSRLGHLSIYSGCRRGDDQPGIVQIGVDESATLDDDPGVHDLLTNVRRDDPHIRARCEQLPQLRSCDGSSADKHDPPAGEVQEERKQLSHSAFDGPTQTRKARKAMSLPGLECSGRESVSDCCSKGANLNCRLGGCAQPRGNSGRWRCPWPLTITLFLGSVKSQAAGPDFAAPVMPRPDPARAAGAVHSESWFVAVPLPSQTSAAEACFG